MYLNESSRNTVSELKFIKFEKNGTEWHENKSKSGTFYNLRAIFFLARRPTHDIDNQNPNVIFLSFSLRAVFKRKEKGSVPDTAIFKKHVKFLSLTQLHHPPPPPSFNSTVKCLVREAQLIKTNCYIPFLDLCEAS